MQYPTPPSVTSVSGCPQTNGAGTAQCPTVGGSTLTIVGTDFVQSAGVKIGAADCKNIVWVNATRLVCTLDAGAGLDLPVVVSSGLLFSPARPLVSYIAPSFTAIAASGGCAQAGATALVDCPRAPGGAVTVTLSGVGFGAANAVVFVGGVQAASVVHDAATPDARVTLLLPANFGLNKDVLLIQKDGQPGSGALSVGYLPCAAGSREDSDSPNCVPWCVYRPSALRVCRAKGWGSLSFSFLCERKNAFFFWFPSPLSLLRPLARRATTRTSRGCPRARRATLALGTTRAPRRPAPTAQRAPPTPSPRRPRARSARRATTPQCPSKPPARPGPERL